jgi:hypothetical protein
VCCAAVGITPGTVKTLHRHCTSALLVKDRPNQRTGGSDRGYRKADNKRDENIRERLGTTDIGTVMKTERSGRNIWR